MPITRGTPFSIPTGLVQAKPEPDEFGFEDWKASRDPKKLKNIVTKLDPLIDSAIKAYAKGEPSPVLKDRARLMAIQAIKSYDPRGGANLKTHVSNNLRALQHKSMEVLDPLPKPERFVRDQAQLLEAQTRLSDILGREPSDEEIAEYGGLPLKRVLKLRAKMRSRVSASALMDSPDDGEDDASFDIIASSHTDFDDWKEAVYHDLPNQDRLIFQYKTGYRGSEILPINEIAKRVNLPPQTVYQRIKRIQQRLDEFDG
jgi:DNA-directed RNA polymerase specialized sigma subunit